MTHFGPTASGNWGMGDWELCPNKTLTQWGEIHWQPDWWIGKIEVVAPGVAKAGPGTHLDSIKRALSIFGDAHG